MRVFLLLPAFLFFSFCSTAQKIHGTVFTSNGDLLPYASITVKGSSQGASANDKGRFSFYLPPGNYTLVCQHIGYTAVEKKIELKDDTELSFILPEQKLTLKEVVVGTGDEDPAYQIIRNAIRKRDFYQKQVNAFSCELYGKDIIKLRHLPKKIFGQKIPEEDRKEMGLDSLTGQGIVYLSESVSTVHIKQPDKFKMEVKSSRVSGSGGFGFTFPAFISLYTNNVTVFTERLNPRGFVSPIADGAIGFYKFKFLGSFWENGKEVNSIRVSPRRLYEPLFTGIINITEGDWRIHSVDLLLTKTAQLEILDSLQIKQQHVPVAGDVWRIKNQLLHFNFKFLKIDALGNFLTVYSDYNIAPGFNKKFFDRVVIKYDTAVNKRSKEYWDSIRPVPLEAEESRDYKMKDSVYQARRDSSLTRNMIDSLNKRQGKLKPYKLIYSALRRTRYTAKGRYSWGIEALLPNAEYNAAEGIVTNVNGYLNFYSRKLKSNIDFEPTIRYGFNNTHLNAFASLAFRRREEDPSRKLNRSTWTFGGGKRVSEFNKESTFKPLINSLSILFYGQNYIKTYENYFGEIEFAKRYESGLRFSAGFLFEDRIPLNNTTYYTFDKDDSAKITPNYPHEKLSSQFQKHQAFIFSTSISFRPGQRYIQLPYSRVPIGSNYPTFTFQYFKGINGVAGSDVNFDKWRFTINDDKNFKLKGLLKYKVGVGGFINDKNVPIQDYQHFNGNQTRAASDYVNSFQLAKYYANSTTAGFYSFGHVEHHFNGLITNKIPLFRKLNWNLVAGSNAFFVNCNNNYIEVFAGLENIFKIFRLDVIAAYENGKQGLTGLRLGAGGAFGSGIKANRSRGNLNLDLSF